MYQLVQLLNKCSLSNHNLPNRYLSPKVQNKLVSLFADEVRAQLISTLKDNKLPGLIGDERTTHNNESVVSMAVRTCDN